MRPDRTCGVSTSMSEGSEMMRIAVLVFDARRGLHVVSSRSPECKHAGLAVLLNTHHSTQLSRLNRLSRLKPASEECAS
jgi:hypothetical protein